MGNDYDRIEQRLVRIEDKIDAHLERVAKSEEAISGLKGYVKILASVITAVVSTGVMILVEVLSRGSK